MSGGVIRRAWDYGKPPYPIGRYGFMSRKELAWFATRLPLFGAAGLIIGCLLGMVLR